jgi:hypothetical protein
VSIRGRLVESGTTPRALPIATTLKLALRALVRRRVGVRYRARTSLDENNFGINNLAKSGKRGGRDNARPRGTEDDDRSALAT